MFDVGNEKEDTLKEQFKFKIYMFTGNLGEEV